MKPKIKYIAAERDEVPLTEEQTAIAAKLVPPPYTGKLFSGPMPKIVDNVLPPSPEEKKP